MDTRNTSKPWLRALLTAVLSVSLAACDDDNAADEPLTVVTAADAGYGAVIGSDDARVEIYRDRTTGAPTQTLYTRSAGGERVRVFNAADGTPQRVLSETSGNSLTVTRTSAERIDYRAYDAAGNYTGGYVLLARNDGLFVAQVIGSPAFSGQVVGQLTGASETGSFAFTPAPDAGLGGVVAVSASALALANAAPAPAPATPQAVRATALPLLDRTAVIAGLAMGATPGVGTGFIPALAAAATTAYAMQAIGLQLFGAADVASVLSQLADSLNTVLGGFRRGSAPVDILGDVLRGASVDRVLDALKRAFDGARDTMGAVVDPARLAALTALAPPGDTAVNGSGVDQSGNDYALTGTLTASGALTATMTDVAGGAPIRITATVTGDDVSGTISGRLGAGTISGEKSVLGACSAVQQSGGKGTFSYSFNTGGATSGSFQFQRDAYAIPDGFRVISNGQVLYDTHGLVSGAETRTLMLVGSSTVFVNVNAPQQGTAWQLTVGCPS